MANKLTEPKRKYGLIPTERTSKDFRFEHEVAAPHKSELPAQFTGLVGYSPKAIDQMSVGMCTGCGTSRALKNLLDSVNYKWPFTPSALDIYAKARLRAGNKLTDDTGASIKDVFDVINELGVCPEDSNKEWSWPFSASDDRWQEMPPEACQKDAALHKVIKYMRVKRDENSIKTALYMGFPLVIGIAVHQSFESKEVAKTGVIPMPGFPFFDPLLGYHCLRLDGYGMHTPDYADGVNSWGQSWGDEWVGYEGKGRGRFHIPFKYLTNHSLTSDIWAVQVMT